MSPIRTKRLEVIPCSLAVAQAAVSDKSQLETLVSVRVPDDWPTPDRLGFLPIYAQMLADDPLHLGWGVWLMIHAKERSLIGDLGFGGKSEGEDTVEMGYEVLAAYRNQGYAFEAVRSLVDWACKQPGLSDEIFIQTMRYSAIVVLTTCTLRADNNECSTDNKTR